MKRFLILILPTILYLAMGQINQPHQHFFAGLFVAIIAIHYLASRQTAETFSSGHALNWKDGMLLLAVFVILGSAFPLGGYLAEPLVMEHAKENAQAIVVLASGAMKNGEPGYSGFQRVTHGLSLLQEGRAPLLVISTGYSRIDGHAEAAWVASFTSMFAVDQASISILISKDIVTTATEAEYIQKILQPAGINRILLVTSNAHIYRSVLTFARRGFEVLPAPTHTASGVYYASEHYLTSINAALHEWIGLVYYSLLGRI